TDVAEKYIKVFHQNMQAMNCLDPTHEPRVSTSMQEIVEMVDALVASGYAYVAASGDVIYRTNRFPTFGQLVNRKLAEQQSGARVEVDSEKESAHDFVLWKANAKSATKMEQAFIPAKYGAKHFSAAGRPGWHIECSAMSKQLAGATLDIHAGGEDLQFPHHSCEIAQSEALSHKPLANYWLHNSFITVGGQKMSKSLGNFTTIPQALEQFPPMALRYWLLQTHYRKPVDFSPDAVKAAAKPAARLQKAIAAAQAMATAKGTPTEAFIAALNDDLNTSKALAELNKAAAELSAESAAEFLAMADVLGINAT
ncbi:MAG: cysteine--tRNA ligase, partial [Proteobacteria bacterium]|nr:cysteine--tRNA ligase [Pseudomonadota bacterium]